MAYFLQGILTEGWASKLAIVEMLMWVGVFSMVFLGRHENKDEVNRLSSALLLRETEIATLRAQMEPVPSAVEAAREAVVQPAPDALPPVQDLPSSPSAAAPEAPGMRISKESVTEV